jgi:hypothetical protein
MHWVLTGFLTFFRSVTKSTYQQRAHVLQGGSCSAEAVKMDYHIVVDNPAFWGAAT